MLEAQGSILYLRSCFTRQILILKEEKITQRALLTSVLLQWVRAWVKLLLDLVLTNHSKITGRGYRFPENKGNIFCRFFSALSQSLVVPFFCNWISHLVRTRKQCILGKKKIKNDSSEKMTFSQPVLLVCKMIHDDLSTKAFGDLYDID